MLRQSKTNHLYRRPDVPPVIVVNEEGCHLHEYCVELCLLKSMCMHMAEAGDMYVTSGRNMYKERTHNSDEGIIEVRRNDIDRQKTCSHVPVRRSINARHNTTIVRPEPALPAASRRLPLHGFHIRDVGVLRLVREVGLDGQVRALLAIVRHVSRILRLCGRSSGSRDEI